MIQRFHYSIIEWAFLLVFAISSIEAQFPDGFMIWSEGNEAERTIMMSTLSSDPTLEAGDAAGEPVLVVEKGDKGGDIQSQISFDGKWLAFSRSLGGQNEESNYGQDNWLEFDKWEVYIASLTGSFPTTPIQVGQGYMPVWGDDSHNYIKTLYYMTVHDGRTVRKVTIDENGIVSGSDQKVREIPLVINNHLYFQGHAQVAPNGKFMALKAGSVWLYFFDLRKYSKKV